MTNYKPISILSIFNKIFEQILFKRMISFINKYDILQQQFGFRKHLSTELAMLNAVDYVKKT